MDEHLPRMSKHAARCRRAVRAPMRLTTWPKDSALWTDRACTIGVSFPWAAGYVLVELRGEDYAISGRLGMPDNDAARDLAARLAIEQGRYDELLYLPPWVPVPPDLLASAVVLARLQPRRPYRFSRYV